MFYLFSIEAQTITVAVWRFNVHVLFNLEYHCRIHIVYEGMEPLFMEYNSETCFINIATAILEPIML